MYEKVLETGLALLHLQFREGYTLFGHVRLLCPSCLQSPQDRLRLGGGGRLSFSVDGVGRVGGGRAGVPGVLELGLGTSEKGQVMSASPSAQNCRILSYKYHLRSADRPFGGTMSGSSLASGVHGEEDLLRSILRCSRTYTTRGLEERQ